MALFDPIAHVLLLAIQSYARPSLVYLKESQPSEYMRPHVRSPICQKHQTMGEMRTHFTFSCSLCQFMSPSLNLTSTVSHIEPHLIRIFNFVLESLFCRSANFLKIIRSSGQETNRYPVEGITNILKRQHNGPNVFVPILCLHW
jgi:hypothetical protein